MSRLLAVGAVASVFALLSGCTSVEQKPVTKPAAALQSLDLVLKPHLAGTSLDFVDVQLAVDDPKIAPGGTALRMPLIIVGIPSTRYDGNAISARDDKGELPLTQEEEAPTPTGTYRRWLATRASVGDVTYTYRAVPRVVTSSTRTGPLFDLRAEGQGFNAAGVSFLALPDTKHSYRASLKWDLSAMPAGSIGVSSLGDGDVQTTTTVDQLSFSFYVAGPLNHYPRELGDSFSMYWFGDLPFDAPSVAGGIQRLFDYMAPFFNDKGGAYRVFIRRNPHIGGGGTASTRSFMFGYSEQSPLDPSALQYLLAHEMTHNWPRMEGEHGQTAWYSEGAAEYYSMLLSYRAGVLSPQQFLDAINQRTAAYYTNPYAGLTNTQAAELFWKDSRAQKIPYGRGLLYLTKVDAQIRAHSGGTRSLRDLILVIREQQDQGKPYGLDLWLDLLTRELGAAARKEFDAMVAGEIIFPPSDAFAPCFRGERARLRAPDFGFDSGYAAAVGTRIAGLKTDSPAYEAGVRDGDEIAAPIPSLDDLKEKTTVTLKLRRGGQPIEFTFAPAYREVDGYRWVRDPSVSDEVCTRQHRNT